jgi:hypothetical protein
MAEKRMRDEVIPAAQTHDCASFLAHGDANGVNMEASCEVE